MDHVAYFVNLLKVVHLIVWTKTSVNVIKNFSIATTSCLNNQTFSVPPSLLSLIHYIAVSSEDLNAWKRLSYVDVVKKVVALFVSENEVPLTSQHGDFIKYFS